MNLGSLATIGSGAAEEPRAHRLGQRAVRHDGRAGHGDSARRGFLAAAAAAMGIRLVATVASLDELAGVTTRVDAQPGPWVIVAKVSENSPTAKPTLDYPLIKRRFMAAMGAPESPAV